MTLMGPPWGPVANATVRPSGESAAARTSPAKVTCVCRAIGEATVVSRPRLHSHTPSEPIASSSATPTATPHARVRDLRDCAATPAIDPLPAPDASHRNSSATSLALCHRAVGSLARHFRTRRSNPGGTACGGTHGIGIVLEDRRDEAGRGFARERSPADGQLVEDSAERKDVGARVDVATLDLFRCHVGKRADEQPRMRHRRGRGRLARRDTHRVRRGRQFRETEVEHFHAGRREHDVAGFQVAVDDAGPMGGGQRVRQLRSDREDLAVGERAHGAGIGSRVRGWPRRPRGLWRHRTGRPLRARASAAPVRLPASRPRGIP